MIYSISVTNHIRNMTFEKTSLERFIFFFSILFRLKRFKQTYMEKNPYEKCYFVRDIHAYLVNLVGLHVVDVNYKMSIKSFISIYVEVNYLSLLVYTVIYYRNEPFKALIATPAAGFLIPVSLFGFNFEMALDALL